MAPKFGTSGLRGLVTELTPELVAAHVRAFLAACPSMVAVHVGWDLRPSSPDIAACVIATLRGQGCAVVQAGAVPTPALAMAAMAEGHGAIMITGSHIPADRNGLKFYTPQGEITKSHETAILAALETPVAHAPEAPLRLDPGCGSRWAARMVTALGENILSGLTLGLYQHSSVARDLLADALTRMGARVVPLARSDIFVPVDTEAVDPRTRSMLAEWCARHDLAAVLSTDGDADRPMVTDGTGRLVPGDVLGPIAARALGAAHLVTPVSSNTLVEAMGDFTVTRTRIGSPYVIEAMEAVLGEDPAARVAGYEANGGFLLGFGAAGPAGHLPPLMTRDCLLPIAVSLWAARTAGQSLAELVAALPARFTAVDRLQGVAPEAAGRLLDRLTAEPAGRAAFFGESETALDLTDGLRATFARGHVIHLRPSGNAPEFRVYAEASDPETAADLLARTLRDVGQSLSAS